MSRALFVAGLAVFVAIVAWLATTNGWSAVEALGVPGLQPVFADVRSLTGAHVALANGIDPLVANAGDPWHRPFNYPRIWLLPAQLGIGPAQTDLVAAALFASFGLGLLALVPLATTPATSWLLLLLLFAPTTWLAIERANNDLVIFPLLAFAARLAPRRAPLAAGCITAASLLKLFPIFALGGLLQGDPRRARRTMLAVVATFVVYLFWIRADLAAIRANAQTWHPISYGITLLPRAVADLLGWPFRWMLATAVLGLVTLGTLALHARRHARLGAAGSPHTLAAFRIGAAVHVGTFALGSNFDYRLIVLLLVVPQLTAWTNATTGLVRHGMRTTLVVLVLVVWSMAWRAALRPLDIGPVPGLVADELLSWTLVAALTTGLVATLPDWLLPAAMRERPWLDAPHPPNLLADAPR